MSLRSILISMKNLLNDNGFERQVEEYGYHNLNAAQTAIFLIIEFAGSGTIADERDVYGGGRVRAYRIRVIVHARMQGFSPTETVVKLGESIDKVMNLFDKYSAAGTGKKSVNIELMTLSGIVEIQSNEGPETQWLACLMDYEVTEQIDTVEIE